MKSMLSATARTTGNVRISIGLGTLVALVWTTALAASPLAAQQTGTDTAARGAGAAAAAKTAPAKTAPVKTAPVTAPTTAAPAAASPSAAARAVYRIPIRGALVDGLVPYVERALHQAAAQHGAAAVLVLETTGGRLGAAQRIADAVSSAGLPVYAYVPHRALSVGALVALATRGIYMDSAAVLGAGGAGVASRTSQAQSAMLAEMRALAERRGLDPAVAEAMVDPGVAVPEVVGPGRLLTLTTEEAARLGYATPVAGWRDMLTHVGLARAPVRDLTPTLTERTIRFLSNPIVAPFLLVLGFLGLILEIKVPHFGLTGFLGALFIALFFGAHYAVGLAGHMELALLGGGVVLIALEVFVIPGFGVAGLLGFGAVLASIYLSMLGHYPTAADYSQAAGVVAATLLAVAVTIWALLRTLPRNRHLQESGVMLGESVSLGGYVSSTSRKDLVGAEGVAVTDLRPAGVGQFGDEKIDIVADGGWIEAGSPIRVVSAEGYRHVVRPVDGDD